MPPKKAPATPKKGKGDDKVEEAAVEFVKFDKNVDYLFELTFSVDLQVQEAGLPVLYARVISDWLTAFTTEVLQSLMILLLR